jgi:hypothetical protein
MNGSIRRSRTDYDLSEWADSFIDNEDDNYQEYENEEEDLTLDQWKKSTLPKDIYYRYAQDVAWVGEYNIEKMRGEGYTGRCNRCKKHFKHSNSGKLKGMIESHILRGCKDPKYSRPIGDEPPF